MATSYEELKTIGKDGFLTGGGEMGERTRSMDWSETPVGPVSEWPRSLKTAVSICLGSRYPIVIWWNTPAYTMFYNDAYIPFLGVTKHPGWLGRSGRECWSEIWPTIGPMLEGVFAAGEATWSEDLLLVLHRNLPREEAYFTFSYSPIRDDDGSVGGIFCACYETTGRVIQERRLRTLRDLSRMAEEAKTAEEACLVAAQTLSENPADIPFALIYLLDGESRRARLVATTGVEAGCLSAPEIIDMEDSADQSELWPLREVFDTASVELITDLADRCGPLPGGEWPESPESASVLPIASPGHTRPTGFLVTGLSPRRIFDSNYRVFFDLIAGQIGTSIANARAYAEERRRAEALAEIDRAKTDFFSNVSHEFRTPITLMLGPLEDMLTKTDSLSDIDRERLEVAHRNSLRLLKLVNTLLDFSRIESGRIQASYEPTDLSALTADLASVFRAAIERAGLRLIVDCPPIGKPVYVDREMWEKSILNLLSNAFKFTFNGEIEVRLRRDGDRAVLTVRDTGAGIPADELEHLFERFHRVKGARGRTFEGSGIGLALVQELVKLHGGTVSVESEVDRGSEFKVSIPLGAAHLPPDKIGMARALTSPELRGEAYVEEALRWTPAEAERLRSKTGEGQRELKERIKRPQQIPPSIAPDAPYRILLADDNADMREYVRRLLSQRYEVEAVADGMAALRAARERAPDLVLTDVMMPGLDGFGLLKELRADEILKGMPVILLSARAGEESRIEGMAAGADDYLTKPFTARELLARVESHVRLGKLRARHDQERSELLKREREAREEVETLYQVSRALAGELDLQKLVQSVTDAGAKLSGAKFGAFFYNVINERGEAFMLYTLTGASRESFEKFGIPRNTPLFDHTFRGAGVIRCDDILEHPDYGKNPPHRGMPEGHLPLRSYLALPVISRTGEVLGGLFFGHPEPGVFTERAERLLTVIAGQAAIAIDDARLFAEAEKEIAQRKQAQEALQESERRFRTLADNAPVLIWVNGQTGCDFVNYAYLEFLGVGESEVLGDDWVRFIHPEDCEEYMRSYLEAFSNRSRFEAEYRFRRRDGEYRWMRSVGMPRFEGSEFKGYVGSSSDIHERKLSETVMAQMAAIVESSDDAIISKDLNGIIASWNKGAERLFGYRAEEVIGKPVTILISPDRIDEEPQILERLKRGEKIDHYETVRRRKDGSEIDISLTVSPVRDKSGKVIGASKIARDITERKRIEIERDELLLKESSARAEAEAANRSKDDFLAVVSHELRSPLNSILGYNSLLRENLEDVELVKQSSDVIERNAKTQLQLIEDLLDTARIVSGKLRLDLRALDINPALDDAISVVRPAAEAKGVNLRIINCGLGNENEASSSSIPQPVIVLGDAARIQQIVWNLLSNAIKFTPAGGTVELSAETSGDHIRIIVSDNGKGVDPDVLPFIFDRFRQADSSAQRYGGLGLGLALVKHLTELHGGKVEAVSEGAGCGVTFTVRLPIATQDQLIFAAEPPALASTTVHDSDGGADDAVPIPPEITIAGLRVLVVDDHKDARVSLADFLNRNGAMVMTAASGSEAIDILSDLPDGARPDILICDITMPDEDGYSALARMRAFEAARGVSASQQFPAIALTGRTGNDERARALSAGFQIYLAKPVDPVELILLIANIAG